MDLIDLIKQEEGFREFVYDDANGQRLVPGYTLKGHATIGYGWACSLNPMTQEEANQVLHRRAGIAKAEAAGLLGAPAWERLGPARRAALAGMIYQMGPYGVRGFPMLLGALRAQDWQRAHDEALDSRWARQTPARARRVALMFLTGEWPEVDAPLVA